jgi:hypothetical protein
LLFQAVQPMNDILVAALWMAVLVSSFSPDPTRPWLLGGLTGLAVFVRPNLAPAAMVTAAWLGVTTCRTRGATVGLLARHALAFAIASAPALLALVFLNTALYGQPLQSGYGSVGDLFAVAHVWPNVRNYGSALIQTQMGFPILGFVALLFVPRAVRAQAWLALWVSLTVIAVYLFYRPFDEWWYLRFLLPATVALTALAVAVVFSLQFGAGRFGGPLTGPATRLVLLLALAASGFAIARDRQVFDLQRLERRFRTTGDVARNRLPANAVFITVWQSGTLRYFAARPAVLWDSLDPAWLDTTVSWFGMHGLDPYIVVEEWEEPQFRARFADHSPIGNLDWPPRMLIERQVKIFKPADRTIYMQGGNVTTERIDIRSRP